MRLARTSKLIIAMGLLVSSFVATSPTAGAAVVTGGWQAVNLAQAPKGSDLARCVDRAQSQRPNAWTCLAGQLTTVTKGADGTAVITRVDVVPPPTSVTKGRTVRPLADDYDSWCESGTICTRKISDYTAEVKGNGAYGDQNGAIGAFDQVMRQSFNGGNPQWRMVLIWDSGPAVNGFNWHTRCRQAVTGPDRVCGDNPYDPATISSANWRTWFPSSTGYVINSQVLSGSSNKFHDENYGAFTASGHSQTFSTGTLHTGRWKGCGACKYYQVPWTDSP